MDVLRHAASRWDIRPDLNIAAAQSPTSINGPQPSLPLNPAKVINGAPERLHWRSSSPVSFRRKRGSDSIDRRTGHLSAWSSVSLAYPSTRLNLIVTDVVSAGQQWVVRFGTCAQGMLSWILGWCRTGMATLTSSVTIADCRKTSTAGGRLA